MSSVVIRSGHGAEFLLEIFIPYFMSSSVKYMLLGLVSVFSRIVVISFSTSFLKVLSWLLLIVLLMLCCFSFSDILKSSKMYVFVILSSMGSTMFFFFLPRTLLYLCQNWFSSRDSFRNFVVFFLSFIFDSFIDCWYFILAICSILAMLCLLLNLWLASWVHSLIFLCLYSTSPSPLFLCCFCLSKEKSCMVYYNVC